MEALIAAFMCFFNMINAIQYTGISVPGSWGFIRLAMGLGVVFNFFITFLIYIKIEKIRQIVITQFTVWVPTALNGVFTLMFFVAHILAILTLTDANNAWWNIHKNDPDIEKRECYECNAWVSRFVISLFFQPAIAFTLFLYMWAYNIQQVHADYEEVPE